MTITTRPPPRGTPRGPLSLALLAVAVGVVAGCGAVVFRGLIGVFHNLLFSGTLSFHYDSLIHTEPGPWGIFVVFVPAIGALGVTFLVRRFGPETRGTGIPEVVDATYYRRGVIHPWIAAVKAVASSLSIGSGGSLGREGPIVQIGSSLGSTIGQVIPMATWQRNALVAAGAGGGVAATFNTPIGGMLFAIEIMMQEVSARTLVPVAIATATAAHLGQLFFGTEPSFAIPSLRFPQPHFTALPQLLAFAGLGVALGAASFLFIRSVYAVEDLANRLVKRNAFVRHVAAMLILGVIMVLLQRGAGHYYIEGVGYASIRDVLTGALSAVPFLLLLALLKMLATALSLGTGSSGGIFSPALFFGATLGAAYAGVVSWIFPGIHVDPATCAVTGMAGVVGGTTGAAMAAIVMTFEMTLDYGAIIPIVITVGLSYGVRKLLLRDSIYTLKLARRGHWMPDALQANFQLSRPVTEVMSHGVATLPETASLTDVERLVSEDAGIAWIVVGGADGIRGVVAREDALTELARIHAPGRSGDIRALVRDDYVTVLEPARLGQAWEVLHAAGASVALVVPDTTTLTPQEVKGTISREQMGIALEETLAMLAD